MKKRYPLLTLSLLLPVGNALANPEVTFREYNLMPDVDQFRHSTESGTVTSLLDYADNAIEQAINRSVSGWVDPDSKTKTIFVYEYIPTFCQ